MYLAASEEGQCTKDLEGATTLSTNLNLQPFTNNNNGVSGGDPNNPNNPSNIDEFGNPITTGIADARVVKDPSTGLWVDTQTGEPAEGTINGVIYEKGDITGTVGDVYEPGLSGTVAGAITFLLHVYYDFDQSYIRDDAESELEKLLTTLENNPDLIIEIGSHTDSRGSYRYNNRLSQRRAEAVVRWLTEKGIDADRLVAAGYGENINVNNCSNNIPCSEREHQMNRRTEFKVIGCRSCDYLNQLISSPNDGVRVSECMNCPFDD